MRNNAYDLTYMTMWMCCLMPDSRAGKVMGDVQQPLRAS